VGSADTAAVLARIERHFDRGRLAAATVRAYRRHCRAYLDWLAGHTGSHPGPFACQADGESAVAAWRRHRLLTDRAGPVVVNQGLAAVTLLYEHGAGLRIRVRRARVARPGPPLALGAAEQAAVERAAVRRGERDAAIIAVLLHGGVRVAECARLRVADVEVTAGQGVVRVPSGSGGGSGRTVPLPAVARARLAAWISRRGSRPGPLFEGRRGPLSASGITQVVLAVGEAAGVPGLRPQRLRHTCAARLRAAGAGPQQVQTVLGHVSLETTARYFRVDGAAGTASPPARFATPPLRS
jgi:integrase